MSTYGEVSNPRPLPNQDCFVEQADDGRYFMVPRKIAVSGYIRTFILDQETGAAIHETADIDLTVQLAGRVIVDAHTRIGCDSTVGFAAVIGSDTDIREKVRIFPFAEIGDRVCIERKVHIRRSARVEDDVIIGNRSVIGKNAEVGAGATIPPRYTLEESDVVEPGAVLERPLDT